MWPRALWERAKSASHFKFDNRVLFIHCRGFPETGIVWFWRRQCWAHFSGGSSHAVGLDTGRSASWSLAFSVNKSRVGVELVGGGTSSKTWKFLNVFLQIHHISWKKICSQGRTYWKWSEAISLDPWILWFLMFYFSDSGSHLWKGKRASSAMLSTFVVQEIQEKNMERWFY